jgi:hypothetical protein
MKRIECNANQRLMWDVVCREANYFIGGLENTLYDYSEKDKEYKAAKAILLNFEDVRVYVSSEVYMSPEWKNMEHTHFITKKWLDTRIFNLTRKALKDTLENLCMSTNGLPERIKD